VTARLLAVAAGEVERIQDQCPLVWRRQVPGFFRVAQPAAAVLQNLPDNALLLTGRGTVTSELQAVECHPAIITLPRVSTTPLALAPDQPYSGNAPLAATQAGWPEIAPRRFQPQWPSAADQDPQSAWPPPRQPSQPRWRDDFPPDQRA
jgi:hypothetical protein